MAAVKSMRVEMHDGRQWVDIGSATKIEPILYEGDPIYLKPITITVNLDIDWTGVNAVFFRCFGLHFHWPAWVVKALLAAALMALTLVLA